MDSNRKEEGFVKRQPVSTPKSAVGEGEPSGAFTPGPWIQDEASICSLDGVPVAQTCRKDEFWSTPDDDMPDSEIQRIQANGCLISTAPELLKAGAKVLAAHDSVIAYLNVGMPARALLQEPDRKAAERAFNELRTAIAKALGTGSDQ